MTRSRKLLDRRRYFRHSAHICSEATRGETVGKTSQGKAGVAGNCSGILLRPRPSNLLV